MAIYPWRRRSGHLRCSRLALPGFGSAAILLAGLFCLGLTSARAEDYLFTDGFDLDSTDPGVPYTLGPGDNIYVSDFDNQTPGGFTIIGDTGTAVFTQTGGTFDTTYQSVSPDPFFVGYSSTGNGTYTISGAGSVLTTTDMSVGYNGTGTFNINGGTVNVSSLTVGGDFDSGARGTGTGVVNQTGGSFTAPGGISLGTVPNSHGEYHLSAGNLSTAYLNVGLELGNGSGTYTQSGGSLVTQSIAVENGTLSLSGGTITTDTLLVGDIGSGTFALTGGSITVNTTAVIYNFAYNAGALHVTTADVTIGGTSTIQGGVFSAASFSVGRGNVTLNAAGLTTNGGGFNVGVVKETSGVQSDTAVFNFSTGSVSTGAAIIGSTESGIVNQTGGTFTTNGNQFLLGGNTDSYGGGGTYNLSAGSLSTGRLALSEDAGPDSLGPNFGTFNQSGGTVTTNGDPLVLGDGLSISRATYNLSGGSLSTGVVTVGGKAGSNQLDFGTFNQTGGTFTTNGNSITLGENAAVGDFAGLGSEGDEYLSGGVLTTGEILGGPGISHFAFNGGTLQAAGDNANFFHDLTVASVQAGGAIIDTNGYNITISQPLVHDVLLGSTVDGGLTVNSHGTLTLTGASTYTGPTTVSAGTLQIGNGGTSGSLSGDSLIINNAALVFDRNDAVTCDSAISGTGSLTQAGAGTLTLTAANTYTGDTTVRAGALTIPAGSTGGLGSTGAAFNLAGGMGDQFGATLNLDGGTLVARTVAATTTGVNILNLNGGTIVAGASNPTFLQGLSTANVRNGGAVFDTAGNDVTVAQPLLHSNLGTVEPVLANLVNPGSGYVVTPTVLVTGGGGYGAAAIAIINFQTGQVQDVLITNPGTNYTSAPTLTIVGGGGAGAAAFSPFVLDNATDGGLTKNGAGTLTLSGASTDTGATNVNAGTLAVTGSLASTATLTVGSGATLAGTGMVAGPVSVVAGGTFSPGLAGGGRLTLQSSLALAGTSTSVFTLSATATNTQVRVGGQGTLGGNLVLTLATGFTPVIGSTFYLIDETGTALTVMGTFANVTGLVLTSSGGTYLVNYAANDPADGSLLPNDLSVTYLGPVVVPEPSTWVLLILGASAFGSLARQARRHNLSV
jgi:fibronectin-binding autotransporter adhesin